MNTCIGWFGIPGGPSYRSTKTHVVMASGKTLCGSKMGKGMEFQWCSYVGGCIPECELCRKALKREGVE
jgi:hypothetical protein